MKQEFNSEAPLVPPGMELHELADVHPLSGARSYRLIRHQLLERYRAGLVKRSSICEADPLLKAAATYHGIRTQVPCPVCGELSIASVLWVYGDDLKRASGSARVPGEIQRFIDEGKQFTIHQVELCRSCGWNHILESWEAG